MDVRVGPLRRLSSEKLMLSNCGAGEDFWESLGLQDDPKGNQRWIFIGRTKAEAPILWSPDAKKWVMGKDLDAGKIECRRRRGRQRTRWLNGIADIMDVSLSRRWEIVKDREDWCAVVHGITKNLTWLGDWTTATIRVHWCSDHWLQRGSAYQTEWGRDWRATEPGFKWVTPFGYIGLNGLLESVFRHFQISGLSRLDFCHVWNTKEIQ